MSGRYFLDTNILVYSFDAREPGKARRARDLIGGATQSGEGIISVQVIQEFLNVSLTKFEKPLSVDDCRSYLKNVLFPICEVYPDATLFDLCLEVRSHSGFSFYDCLIVAAASKGRCRTLYSEDMQDGYRFREVTVVNPFLG